MSNFYIDPSFLVLMANNPESEKKIGLKVVGFVKTNFKKK